MTVEELEVILSAPGFDGTSIYGYDFSMDGEEEGEGEGDGMRAGENMEGLYSTSGLMLSSSLSSLDAGEFAEAMEEEEDEVNDAYWREESREEREENALTLTPHAMALLSAL